MMKSSGIITIFSFLFIITYEGNFFILINSRKRKKGDWINFSFIILLPLLHMQTTFVAFLRLAYRISVSRATHAPFRFLTTPCGPLHKCHMSCTIQLILYIFVEFSVVDACLLLRVLRSEFSELSCGLLGLINVTEHFLKAMDICTVWYKVVMQGSCLPRKGCYKMLISLLLLS